MSNSQHPQNTLHSRSLKLYSKQPIQSIPFLNNAKRHPIEPIYCQPVQQVAITFFPLHRLTSARQKEKRGEILTRENGTYYYGDSRGKG